MFCIFFVACWLKNESSLNNAAETNCDCSHVKHISVMQRNGGRWSFPRSCGVCYPPGKTPLCVFTAAEEFTWKGNKTKCDWQLRADVTTRGETFTLFIYYHVKLHLTGWFLHCCHCFCDFVFFVLLSASFEAFSFKPVKLKCVRWCGDSDEITSPSHKVLRLFADKTITRDESLLLGPLLPSVREWWAAVTVSCADYSTDGPPFVTALASSSAEQQGSLIT